MLAGAVRRKVNLALIRAGMDGNARFRSAGHVLSEIVDVLEKFGLELEDTVHTFRLTQAKGRVSFEMNLVKDPLAPVPIRNSSLALHWDTLDTGIEAVAYLG